MIVFMIFLPNVEEHATPLAGAGVETGVEVHATGDVPDKAASGGCVSRLVVPSSYCVESDLPGSGSASPGQINNLEHDLGKMGYNRTTIAALIHTAQDYGVRMLESDFIDNQTAGSYEGVMIFRGEFSEILDGVLYRRISPGTIQQRLEALRSVRKELPVTGFTLGAVDGFKSAGADSGDEVSHGGFGCHDSSILHNANMEARRE
jgi:hypothetical protein